MRDHTAADGQTGFAAFSLSGIAPAAMGRFCGELGVAIRTGGHCAVPLSTLMGVTGTGRVSIAVHATKDEMGALLTAIETCRRTYLEG